MTASPSETPSARSRLRVSVQPAKPDLPIKFLYEELLNVDMFSAHNMFTTFCAQFSQQNISFQDPGYALGLYALFIADTNPGKPCVSRSLGIGNTFLILGYSKAKWQKCLSWGAISHSDAVFF